MAGKRYSAGAIFLQVVPVFANVQRAIEDEAKNIDRALGDQMEKSGEKAGQRAGKAAAEGVSKEMRKLDIGKDLEKQVQDSVKGFEKALGDIDTSKLGDRVKREVRAMRAELESLGDVDLNVDDNFKEVAARIAALRAHLKEMEKDSNFRLDMSGLPDVYRALASVQKAIDKIDGDINLDVDTKAAERKIGAFEKRFKKTAKNASDALGGSISKELRKIGDELKYLENLRIGVDISGNRARAELNEIKQELEELQKNSPDIDVRVDSMVALGEIAALEAALAKLEQDDVDVDVHVNSDGLRKASRDGEDAANSFRSFNVVLLAVTGAGPALVPVLAAIAGGLLALGPAAAVGAFGLGSVLVGFSGIGDALSALQSQQDAAATNAQSNAGRQEAAANQIRNAQEALADAVRNAARAEEDAAERVADARRNAARAAEDAAERVADAREQAADAIEEALERQKDAQEEYRDAVKDVADAEQALRDARAEAEADAADLATRQRQNAVDERQAVLDLGEAQNEYNSIMADGSSTNTDREQASVNLEQAQIALNETRTEQVALAEEAADYAANGVDGSEKVQDAQDAVTSALEDQKDAQEAVKEAAEAADEARVDGAEAVSEALEEQKEILSDNAREIRQALEDQAESHADNQRAIERAQQALADARASAVSDLNQIDSQAQAVKNAFDKLGPAGAVFATFLFSLREGFYEFRDAVQQAMLPAVQRAIEGFLSSPNAGAAGEMFIELARSFGLFTEALSRSFQGPAWERFFEMMATTGAEIATVYGDAFISLMEAMADVMVTAAPFALLFAEGLASMMESFADWAASEKGQQAILGFLAYVEEMAPAVLEFFGAFVGAVVALAEAIAPYGETILAGLTAVLDFIANMDGDVLAALFTSLTVVLFASQVAYGVMNLMMAGAALFATAVGPWVFLIVGIGLALVYLYQTNEEFREFVITAWEAISTALKKAWDETLKPALTELWEAFLYLWDEVLAPFLEWLGPVLIWVAEHLIPLLARVWATKMRFIADAITIVLVPAVKTMWDAFKWLWEKVLRPAWNAMSSLWDEVVDEMVTAWEDYLQPMWNTIKDDALPALQTAFESVMGVISGLWEELKRTVGAPIKFILADVINGGLIAGYNKVAGWVDAPPLDPVTIPDSLQKYASGGIMPGYTPGRDPHKFVSPTGGRLELSGGEAVMRPEWTAAMGPGYVNYMNSLARQGGVEAVRKAANMGAYWLGGILPLPGGSVSAHSSGYSGYAADMNYPGYADYGVGVKAWKAGKVAQMNYIGDSSYGRWVVLNHGTQSSLYAHLSNFADIAVGKAVAAGQTIGYVGDIGNTGNPPTSHLHFEINGGSVDYADSSGAGTGKAPQRPKIPSWLMGVIKDPLAAFKGWITDPLQDAASSYKDSDLFRTASKVPALLGQKVTDKVWDIVPGWAKTTAGWASGAADWAVGGVSKAADAAGDVVSGTKAAASAVADALGFADGGILPYNGTMMYDSGGYLPPGLTTVMNLTGKPEPVFTADQFAEMGIGGEGFTYAPTFQGSNLTAADVVDDLDFARRKIRREGKYGRSR